MPILPAFTKSQFSLPPAPMVLQKLSEMMNGEDVSSAEVGAVVETDQACTARLLRVVNSPFYGFTRKITSVAEAITMLGLKVVHQLFLTTSVFNAFKDVEERSFLENFWRHSFGVGIVAKHLLQGYGQERRDRAFIAGILHDIGRLAFMKADIKIFRELYFRDQVAIGLEDEVSSFGIDHQSLGRLLAEKWNFPEELAEVIGYHHTPESSANLSAVLAAVNLADLICHALHIGDSGTYYVTSFSPAVIDKLAITDDRLESLLRASLSEIDESKGLFGDVGFGDRD